MMGGIARAVSLALAVGVVAVVSTPPPAAGAADAVSTDAASASASSAEAAVFETATEDDECAAVGAEGSCALSAAQLRAERLGAERSRRPEASSLGGASLASAARGAPAAAPARNASFVDLDSPTYDVKCFAYTGGTCVTEACNAERKAECVSGKCVCSGCAGADGTCHDDTNKLVASGFYLKNAKYDQYKMYFQRVSTFGQLSTTKMWSSLNFDQDKFSIYELPGKGEDGKPEYFLGSYKWSDYVVGFKATTGTAFSPFAAYAVDLNKKGKLLSIWGPSNIMLNVCRVNKASYQGGLQIGAKISATGGNIWAYVHGGSWFVYGSLSSPGEGGIWYPDPPLPATAQIPECD